MPRATYRVQFTKDFGFDAAAALAPYLARLGVSHLYASPYLKARPGSTHGYDIVDHNRLNPELGDDDAFERMAAALAANGLKQILDFVPNHMGVGGADNPFWLDVLEWGPESPYAGWFDVDWSPDRDDLHDRVLVPVLGEQLGVAIERGAFALRFDADAGSFAVWVYDTHKLPIRPIHYGEILGTATVELERLGDEFASLAAWRPRERERVEALKANLADLVRRQPGAETAFAMGPYAGRPGEPASWAVLERLMRKQVWRPAYFRVAADDINYRRFFNIAELAGLRMELPAVFDHAHRLVFDLLGRGVLDGLRIDHIDGLLDPKGYLQRLRAGAPPAETPCYLVVEKILAEGEPLRADWPVDGTTGYEVTNQLLGVLVDPAGEIGFTRVYADFTGRSEPFGAVLRESKKRIMDNEMASELAGLARAASRVAGQTSRTADFTRNILRRAIREIVASFPVYRTYIDDEGAVAVDRAVITAAIEEAKSHESAIDHSVYAFLQSLLTGDLVAAPKSGFSRSAVLRFAMTLQQYSGPVMAKGLEDTSFYRFNRFIALNEVGGDPRQFGRTLEAFHAANADRAAHWPGSMLTTSTHDTKRGEDARARLAALSERPDAWAETVAAWSRCLRDEGNDPAAVPDRNDEYALYQTLLATLPPALLDPEGDDAGAWSAYAERLTDAMRKAMREARVHTSWAAPDEAYEAAMAALIRTALAGTRAAAFRPLLLPFASWIARAGVDNGLVQTALKLTIPGVPDVYQGAELWDLSMVDPDNRRPVDFEIREQLLREVQAALASDRKGAMEAFLEQWPDGRIKLAVTTTLLALRRDQPALFEKGVYEPVPAEGPGCEAICAFVRRHRDATLLVVAARFPGRRHEQPLDGVQLRWPATPSRWQDVLTGTTVESGAALPALLATLPVAVLMAGPGEAA